MPDSTIAATRAETLKPVAPVVLIGLVIIAALFFCTTGSPGKQDFWKRTARMGLAPGENRRPRSRLSLPVSTLSDGRSCFPYASEAIGHIYRVSPDEVKEDAAKVFAVLHPEDVAAVRASIQHSADALTLWNQDYRVRFADGTVRWLNGTALPRNRRTARSCGTDSSRHQRGKLQQIELESLSECLRATINAALDCIIVMDSDGRIIEFNPAAEQIFGYRREDVIGCVLADTIVPEKYRQAHNQGMKHYLETGTVRCFINA